MLKAYEKTKESADVKGNIEAKSLATVERERERATYYQTEQLRMY